MESYKIHLSYRYLSYSIDNNSIELDIESLTDGKSIIYVPNNEKWKKNFPAWANNKKDEIMEDIKEEIEMNYEIKKYIFKEY